MMALILQFLYFYVYRYVCQFNAGIQGWSLNLFRSWHRWDTKLSKYLPMRGRLTTVSWNLYGRALTVVRTASLTTVKPVWKGTHCGETASSHSGTCMEGRLAVVRRPLIGRYLLSLVSHLCHVNVGSCNEGTCRGILSFKVRRLHNKTGFTIQCNLFLYIWVRRLHNKTGFTIQCNLFLYIWVRRLHNKTGFTIQCNLFLYIWVRRLHNKTGFTIQCNLFLYIWVRRLHNKTGFTIQCNLFLYIWVRRLHNKTGFTIQCNLFLYMSKIACCFLISLLSNSYKLILHLQWLLKKLDMKAWRPCRHFVYH